MSSCTRLTEWIGSWFGNPTTQETSSKEPEESNALAVSPAENNPSIPVVETAFGRALRTIIEKCEFPDLIQILPSSKLISKSTLFSINKELWESVRNQFNQWNPVPTAKFLPLENGSAQEQVQAKVLHNSNATKEDLQTCEDFESFPEDIKKLVQQDKVLSFEEIEYLKEFRQARDTLVVWEVLSENIQGDFSYDDLQSSQDWIAKAKTFGEWVDENIGNLRNLTTLDLNRNNLITLPPSIGKLTNLTTLYLSCNNLTTLPTEIGNFTNLTQLFLSKNQISSVSPEISKLTNLTTLDLSGNNLTILPPEIGKLMNLTKLNLNGNNLTRLPPEIGNLSNLTFLRLESNNLTTLPPEIGKLTNLRHLYLFDNQLTTLPIEVIFLRNIEYLDDTSLISFSRCTIL